MRRIRDDSLGLALALHRWKFTRGERAPAPRTHFLFLSSASHFHPLLLSASLFQTARCGFLWDSCGRLIPTSGIVHAASSSQKCSWLRMKGWVRGSDSSSASGPRPVRKQPWPHQITVISTVAEQPPPPHPPHPTSSTPTPPQTKFAAGRPTPRSHVQTPSKYLCVSNTCVIMRPFSAGLCRSRLPTVARRRRGKRNNTALLPQTSICEA